MLCLRHYFQAVAVDSQQLLYSVAHFVVDWFWLCACCISCGSCMLCTHCWVWFVRHVPNLGMLLLILLIFTTFGILHAVFVCVVFGCNGKFVCWVPYWPYSTSMDCQKISADPVFDSMFVKFGGLGAGVYPCFGGELSFEFMLWLIWPCWVAFLCCSGCYCLPFSFSRDMLVF